MYFYDTITIYCKSLECIPTEKKELLCHPQVFGPHSHLIWMEKIFFMKLVLSPTHRKGNTKTANSRLMQRMYQCLLLFFFLYAYLCLLSSVVIYQYNILALEHQFSPGKYWNPYSLNLIIIKYALKKYAVNVISSMQTDLYTSEILSSVGL